MLKNQVLQGKTNVVNFIILLAKQYIYRQKWLKGNLNIRAFERYCVKIENVEKYIAIKNDRLKVHNKKWRLYSSEYNQIQEQIK